MEAEVQLPLSLPKALSLASRRLPKSWRMPAASTLVSAVNMPFARAEVAASGFLVNPVGTPPSDCDSSSDNSCSDSGSGGGGGGFVGGGGVGRSSKCHGSACSGNVGGKNSSSSINRSNSKY